LRGHRAVVFSGVEDPIVFQKLEHQRLNRMRWAADLRGVTGDP
jgi:hypothetical protein